MAIERISVTPLRDGKYPTSQYWNKLVGQINERILENVGGVDGQDAQLAQCFDRVWWFFEQIRSQVPAILATPPIALPIIRLYDISRNVDPQTLTDDERLIERQESRAEVRALITPLVAAIFDEQFNRGWVAEADNGAQRYPHIRNDLGDEKPQPRAKWVGEVLAAWVSHEANGGDKETEDDDDYTIRDVAPDYERLLAEPQFRFAHEFTTDPPTLDNANPSYTHVEMEEVEDENGDIEEVEVPISEHKFAIFELVGDGEYILDEGLPTERSVVLDKYLWLETPYITIRKTDTEDTSCDVIAIEKRKITYGDLCVLTYTLTHRIGTARRATKQKDLFLHYFNDTLLKANRATLEFSDAKPYEDTPAAQNAPLGRFGYKWATGRSGNIRVKQGRINVGQDPNTPFFAEYPLYDPDNERFEVEPDDTLVEGDLYYVDFRFVVRFSSGIPPSAETPADYGNIAESQILQFRYVKEETEDPNDPDLTITKYYMELDDDRDGATIAIKDNVSLLSGIYDVSEFPPHFNDLVPNTRYWILANGVGQSPATKYQITNIGLGRYVKPIEQAHEDGNLTQEKTDTRVFSHIVGDVMTYLRCIATSFSIADPVLGEDEDPDISDSVDTLGTQVQSKITTTAEGIRVIKDYTIERYAKVLGIENFITSVDGRDHFSTLPNTDYARAVLSKLNDGINLLRAIRIRGIPAALKLTETSYEWVGDDEQEGRIVREDGITPFDMQSALVQNLVEPTQAIPRDERHLHTDGINNMPRGPFYIIPSQGNFMPSIRQGTDADGNPTQSIDFFYSAGMAPPGRDSYTQIGEPKVLWLPTNPAFEPYPTSQRVDATTLEGPELDNKLVRQKTNVYSYFWRVSPWDFVGLTPPRGVAFHAGYAIRQLFRKVNFKDVLMEIKLRQVDVVGAKIPPILRDRFLSNPVIMDLRGIFSARSLRGETVVNGRRVPLTRTTEVFDKKEAHNYAHGADDFTLADKMIVGLWGIQPTSRLGFTFGSGFVASGAVVSLQGNPLDEWVMSTRLLIDNPIYDETLAMRDPNYEGPGMFNVTENRYFYKGGGVQVPQAQQGLISLY